MKSILDESPSIAAGPFLKPIRGARNSVVRWHGRIDLTEKG